MSIFTVESEVNKLTISEMHNVIKDYMAFVDNDCAVQKGPIRDIALRIHPNFENECGSLLVIQISSAVAMKMAIISVTSQ